MRGQHWCDFEWDPAAFPDPEGMLARLKAKGLRICVWINPYIAQRSKLFDEGMAKGYLLRRPDGAVWQWDKWQSGMGLVDFTNPEACDWYAGHLERLVAMGVDCFKTDFGERIPTDVVYFDGADPEKMHNYYAFLYNRLVFETLEAAQGRRARRSSSPARRPSAASAFPSIGAATTWRPTIRWPRAYAAACRSGCRVSASGATTSAASRTPRRPTSTSAGARSASLSSHSRLHGFTSYRVPWLYDEEAVDVLRAFTKLKCRLMPYLFAAAAEATRSGAPMMRAMMLEFPDDPACETLDRQYMLGPSLLVAPVFSEDGQASFYLPEGRWTHLLSGEVVDGGRWRKERHGFDSLPLYARPNRLIAWGRRDDRPDYDFADGAVFAAYALDDHAEASASIADPSGREILRLTVRRDGAFVDAAGLPSDKVWTLRLPIGVGVTKTDGDASTIEEGSKRLVKGQGICQDLSLS